MESQQRMEAHPKLYMIGNAHIDPVWLWRWQEGLAEVKATFRSALDRMREFPEFIFTCACAAYYQWVESNCPEMFAEIRQRVEEGRWVIVGGWWIQPDCNLPCGESYVRQSLYSQRYFLQKFGRMATVGYNVDSFGHNGMLPQILKKSGMDYYVFMRPMPQEKDLPDELFWWKSSDGSQVMAFRLPLSYNALYFENGAKQPMELYKLQDTIKQAEEQGKDLMSFYGVGNHGGGPTIATLHMIGKMREELGVDRLIFSSPNAFFKEMAGRKDEIPVVEDELQNHARGCYSTFSEIKRNNRRAEHRLLTAEKFSSIAYGLLGLDYPGDRIARAWQNVLFNQFHDILGGCSIKEAYDDARESHGEALHIAAEALNSALQKISWDIDTMGDEVISLSKEKDWTSWDMGDRGVPMVVFNPHSWQVKAPVVLHKEFSGITDDGGKPVEIQKIDIPPINLLGRYQTLFMGDIPPLGYRVYWCHMEKDFQAGFAGEPVVTGDYSMENEYVRVEIEPHTGYIRSYFDKRNNIDILCGASAVPIVIDMFGCDTWGHDASAFDRELARFADAEVRWMEKGPLRARLRTTSRYNRSVLAQDFILYRDKPDIEIQVRLNWQERLKMLKFSYLVNVEEPHGASETPYGFTGRNTMGEEEPCQQWVDLAGNVKNHAGLQYGLSLINDAKYAYSINGNEIRMTAVNSAIFAEFPGGRNELCEVMDQGIQEFGYRLVPHQGGWQTGGIVKKAYEFNVPLIPIMETYHIGSLPQISSGIEFSSGNVIATVLKRAEDGHGYILRCYETDGTPVEATVEIPMLTRKWTAAFGKCEIKTFFIPDDLSAGIHEKNLLEL